MSHIHTDTRGQYVHQLGSDTQVHSSRDDPPRLFLASLIALMFLRAIAAVPSIPMPIFPSLIVATHDFPAGSPARPSHFPHKLHASTAALLPIAMFFYEDELVSKCECKAEHAAHIQGFSVRWGLPSSPRSFGHEGYTTSELKCFLR